MPGGFRVFIILGFAVGLSYFVLQWKFPFNTNISDCDRISHFLINQETFLLINPFFLLVLHKRWQWNNYVQ